MTRRWWALAGLLALLTGRALAEPVRCVDGKVPAEADYATRADISSHFRPWFSVTLTHLREPPLTCADDGTEIYRFVWLRSFKGAVSVRITIVADKAIVTARTSTVPVTPPLTEPGYMTLRPQDVEYALKLLESAEITELSAPLDGKSVATLRQAVAAVGYWDLPTPEPPDPPGDVRFDGAQWIVEGSRVRADGDQWIVEGVRGGRYHVVDRWSPEPGAYRDLALLLQALGGVKVPPAEDN